LYEDEVICKCDISHPRTEVKLMPGFINSEYPRDLSYPWNKKQQHFINTKSRIIIRIICPELTPH